MTVFAFLFAIIVLVMIHELGHYGVARWCGVKVLKFSLGFGKAIYTKRFAGGETEWIVSLIPLGGYVKMLDEREGDVPPEELSRAFNRQPVQKRMAIVVAGPLANLLLAICLYFASFVHGVPGVKPMLGAVPPATPAANAQLHEGDMIVSINGKTINSWQEIRWALLDIVLQQVPAKMEVQDPKGMLSSKSLDASSLSAADLDGDFVLKLGLQPYHPPIYPVIDKLVPDGAAERAGLQSQDKIVRVNGVAMSFWDDFVTAVRNHPGSTLSVEIERTGEPLVLNMTPDTISEGGKQIGRIGAAPLINRSALESMLVEVHYPVWGAMGEALHKTWETSLVSIKMMLKMATGDVSLKNLSGPIAIADYAGQSAQLGIGAYLDFLALISISLGILNLLPIPLLDGGHLLYYTVELVKGSPVPEKIWEAGQNIGIALLATMMVFALYNDISRLILG